MPSRCCLYIVILKMQIILSIKERNFLYSVCLTSFCLPDFYTYTSLFMSHQAQPDIFKCPFLVDYVSIIRPAAGRLLNSAHSLNRLTCITGGRTPKLSLFYPPRYFVDTPCCLATLSSPSLNRRCLLSYPRELFLNFYRVLLFAQSSSAYHVRDL